MDYRNQTNHMVWHLTIVVLSKWFLKLTLQLIPVLCRQIPILIRTTRQPPQPTPIQPHHPSSPWTPTTLPCGWNTRGSTSPSFPFNCANYVQVLMPPTSQTETQHSSFSLGFHRGAHKYSFSLFSLLPKAHTHLNSHSRVLNSFSIHSLCSFGRIEQGEGEPQGGTYNH